MEYSSGAGRMVAGVLRGFPSADVNPLGKQGEVINQKSETGEGVKQSFQRRREHL